MPLLLSRFLAIIFALFSGLALVGVWYSPVFWWAWLICSLVVILIAALLLAPTGEWRAVLVSHAIAPLCLVIATLGLFMYVDSDRARVLIILAVVALLGLHWENLRRRYWTPERCNPEEREDVAILLKLVTFFALSSGFYRLLLDPTVLPGQLIPWVFAIGTGFVLAVALLLELYNPWLERYQREHPAVAPRAELILVISPLLVGEVFWVANFLPASPDVKAFLVTLTAYLTQNISRSHFDGTLDTAQLRRYLYLSGAALLAVLLSAQWLV